MARQSYAILSYAASALDAARPSYDPVSSYDRLAELVHSLIERLVWVDGRMDLEESAVIEGLLAEDRTRSGALAQRLGQVPSNPYLLEEIPEFIRECRRYDAVNGTRLESTVVNALDTLGMAVVAADREITEEEFESLQKALAPCYSFLGTRKHELSFR